MWFGAKNIDIKFHFVAMEYYWLILNRSFNVFVTENDLFGIKILGPVMALPQYANDPKWQDPESFVPSHVVDKYRDVNLDSTSIRNVNRSNFVISRSQIHSVSFDESTKWGMGSVPHSGKLYVKSSDGNNREFILLGNQKGFELRDKLLS